MRFILITVMLSILIPLPSVVGPACSFAEEKIIVGGDHENPPYEFMKDGKATGFNVELMRAVADVLGLQVEFRLGPWGEVRNDLEQGKIDALAGMYYSDERSKLVDFSVFHTMVSAGLFVRDGSPISSIEDIKGKEVIVQKGDVIDDFLRENGITPHIIEVKDPADELRLLASGSHDCALMPSRLQGEYLKRTLGIAGVRGMSTDLPQLRYCFAVRKGNGPLRYRLDEGLNILKANGRYNEIYDKWFGVYEEKTFWRTVKYFVLALAVIAGLLAVSSIWSWFLRREVRKRTAELKEREESLQFTQFAIDNAADQAYWVMEDGRLFYVNAAACLSLGYTREELLQLSIPDIDPNFQPERFSEHWQDLKEKGAVTFETCHRTKDGRLYPVEIRAKYVVFDGKEYNCAFATDISERIKAEEILRESEEKFRVLAETSPAAICVYQGENLVYLNSAMTRLTGYTEQELAGMRFWEWIHEDFRESARERGKAIQGGEPLPSKYEIKIVTKGGEGKWLLISAGRIEYKGGPAGIVTMFDNTDRKRMEENLQHAYDDLEKRVEERTLALKNANDQLRDEIIERRHAEEALRQSQFCIDKAGIGIFQSDEKGAIFSVNEHACKNLGYSKEELCALSVFDIDPEITPERMLELKNIIDEKGSMTHHTTHKRRDGSTFPVEITANNLEFRGKSYCISFVKDITRRKQAEETLKHQKQLLEYLNRTLEERISDEVAKNRDKDFMLIQQNRQAAMGEILDHVAHQWKQPLYSISLISYLLKDNDSLKMEEVNETVDKIHSQVDFLSQTLNDFREFYRPDKEQKLFQVKESMDRAFSFLMSALQFESVKVDIDIASGLTAFGYPKEFTQVILNLVGNARDVFKERKVEKPKLVVRGFAEEEAAVVTVTDNAGGISEETMDSIFDMNFTTKESIGGTGIGLYMSRNIIEQRMGGTLSVGNVDDGARFTIRLARTEPLPGKRDAAGSMADNRPDSATAS